MISTANPSQHQTINDRLHSRPGIRRTRRSSGILYPLYLACALYGPNPIRVSSSLDFVFNETNSSLHSSAALLDASFDPSKPIAASAYVGPSYPTTPSFGDLLRQKWNAAVGSAVHGARETDWIGMGKSAYEEARIVASKLGSAAENAAENAARDVKRGLDAGVAAAQITSGVEGASNPAAYDLDQKTILSRTDVHVDRKLESGERNPPAPKRLV